MLRLVSPEDERLLRVCGNCRRSLHTEAGVRCTVFDELIFRELAAVDCDLFISRYDLPEEPMSAPTEAPPASPLAAFSSANPPVSTTAGTPSTPAPRANSVQGSVVTVNTQTGQVLDEALVIPRFEGKEVKLTRAQITGADLGIEDRSFEIDDMVKLVVEARVVAVNHLVNEKTGELERRHKLKVANVDFGSWDASNPADDGVARA